MQSNCKQLQNCCKKRIEIKKQSLLKVKQKMQSDDSETRELSRLDYNLARIHGEMVHFDILDVDQQTGRYKCVATFADDFQHASMRTRAQVTNAYFCMQTKEKKQQNNEAVMRRHTALPRPENGGHQQQPFEVDRSHLMRTRPQQLPAHMSTPDMNQMSLKDYARATPQRNRLLNGKLFTNQLLHTIDRGAIPDAMK